MRTDPTNLNLSSAELAARLGCRAADHPFSLAMVEARPFAERIVAARIHPARFTRVDIADAVRREQNAIASTAISQRRSVEEVVRRHHPELFGDRTHRATAGREMGELRYG